MNHLLNDVYGVDVFIESPGFDMNRLIFLTGSSYPVIQSLAIEILKQVRKTINFILFFLQ